MESMRRFGRLCGEGGREAAAEVMQTLIIVFFCMGGHACPGCERKTDEGHVERAASLKYAREKLFKGCESYPARREL